MTGDGHVGHAFISHAPGDAAAVIGLQEALEASGTPVWRDTSVLPGDDWRATIRRAISDDALAFVVCFSRNSLAATVSRQNEELSFAIEQMRLRRPGVPWLISVRLDDCVIPDLDIGAGRTLASIKAADLFGAAAEAETGRLVTSIQRILGSTGKHAEEGGTPPWGDHQQGNPSPGRRPEKDSPAAEADVKKVPPSNAKERQRESAGSLTDIQLVSVGVLTMVAAFLALRWSFFRIISIVTVIFAGSAAWHFSRRLGRSWTDKSVLFSPVACLGASLVLAATYLPGGIGSGHPVSCGLKPPSGSSSAPVVSLLGLTPRRLTGDTLSAGRSPGRVNNHTEPETLHVIFPGASFLRLLVLQQQPVMFEPPVVVAAAGGGLVGAAPV